MSININKKYVLAGTLATAFALPIANSTDSYAAEARTTTAAVNFRSGPSTKHKSYGIIPKGSKVTYLSSSGKWVKVKYNSKTGYVHKNYISSSSVSTSKSTKYVTANGGLNLRKGPSTKYSTIKTLAKGSKVTVKSTSNGWSKVKYGSTTGYVSSSYLSSKKPSSSVSTSGASASKSTKYVTANGGLNLRKGPSTKYSTIKTLAKGSKVTVKSTSSGWSKVKYGSTTGYVSSSYLSSKKPSSSVSTSGASTSVSASKVINFAKSLLGRPYVWGAQGPSSFDCSGFTHYVFKNAAGKIIPRTSSAQSGFGTYVSKSNLKAGDLLFFDTVGPNNRAVTHCGIYIGSGKFIHAASGQGRVVINDLNSSYYVNAYVNARRVL
ncbi:C40 family peptidase [Terrisporobacter sp.]